MRKNLFFNFGLRIVFVFMMALLCVKVKSQDRIDSILERVSKFPTERLYIAYSKKQYTAGETIRFKVFVFSEYHLSDISTNVYVEFLNKKKQEVDKKIFPVIGGIAEGSIDIPDSLPENVYYIRAFTKWMLNAEEANQYVRPINIYNPSSSLKLRQQNFFSAAAFAEGGNLLSGRTASVAVRLYSTGKLPSKWNGFLIDDADSSKKILSFSSIDPNVAVFNFIPTAGKHYSAIIEDENKNRLQTALPGVQYSGAGIQTSIQQDTLTYMFDFAALALNKTYHLVGTVNHNLVYKASFKNTDSVIIHSFSTANLTRGVLKLSLLDENYKMISERLCFLYPKIAAAPAVDTSIFNNAPRGYNKLSIELAQGKSYNVSVMDEQMNDPFEYDNLISAFWLSSEYTDIINPAVYFHDFDRNKSMILDALMITEKSKDFDWNKIQNDYSEKTATGKDNFLSYEIQVTYRKKPLSNEVLNLVLFLPDSTNEFYQAATDSAGKFVLDGLLFEGRARLSFQSSKKRRLQQDIEFSVSPLWIAKPYSLPFPPSNYILTTALENYTLPEEIQRSVDNLTLEKIKKDKFKIMNEVVVKTKQKSATEQLEKRLTGGVNFGGRQAVYDFVNVKQPATGGVNILQWLQERQSFNKYTRYYVDGISADESWAGTISASDVLFVKVEALGGTKTIRIYTVNARPAAIAPIFSEKSAPPFDIPSTSVRDTIGLTYLNNRILSPSFTGYGKYNTTLNSIPLPGYTPVRELPSPNYSTEQTGEKDTRDLLYWSGLLEADKSVTRELPFYNNDRAKGFRVVVIGFSDDETPVFYEQNFR